MVGDQWLDDANSLTYGGYELLNIKVGFQNKNVDRILNAYIGVNNVLDERYASMILINAKGFSGAQPRYYYPGLPRNVYVGLSMIFK
ncbi:MAG: TonB-dependent receptor, partial [Bacteroidetes bacterium]|nr:TonB-dependent receptor [Bacteroidota bacterium]